MFAPSEFSAPPPPPRPFRKNRLVGALVLLLFILACVVMSLSMDRVLFIPYNATHAVTQTWEANHPGSPVGTGIPSLPRPRRTSTPNPGYDQQVRNRR